MFMAKNYYNEVLFSDQAKLSILRGIEKLAKAVKATLGPKGSNILIEKPNGYPLITKDGVTVARAIKLKDNLERLGASMVQEVANKTADTAGDGTSTATILAEAIFKQGLKFLNSGYNAIKLKREMDVAVDFILKEIKKLAMPINTYEDAKSIATIATNGDTLLGSLLAEAIYKVGDKGTVMIEEKQNVITDSLSYVEGMQLERSYLSSYFITDFNKFEVNYDLPKFLIINDSVDDIKPLLPILELCAKNNYPLIISVNDIEEQLLATLVTNKLKNVIKVAVIHNPGFGDYRDYLINDFACRVGATVFHKTVCPLNSFVEGDLGTCKKISINRHETIIVEGSGDITNRVAELQNVIATLDEPIMKERFQQRLNYLLNKIAIINIGAISEMELKDKKLRIEDALHATRAALSEGVVPGGGVALLRIKQIFTEEMKLNPVLQTNGAQVIYNILTIPIDTILTNAGQNVSKITSIIEENKEDFFGYDAAKDVFGNLINLGIIDPAKVTTYSLMNANSVAGMLLTTEGAITIEEEEV